MLSCDNTIPTSTADTTKDTVHITTYHYDTISDTVMIEYDYYKSDTVMMILQEQGRYLFINYYDNDTVMDYTHYSNNFDTIYFPAPREMDLIFWDKDNKWDWYSLKGRTKYKKDGYSYRLDPPLITVSSPN